MGKDLKGFQPTHDAKASASSGGTSEESFDGIDSNELQQEEVLHQQPAFASEVLKTVVALVAVLDRQGRIVSFNRACEEATGYSLAEVKGKYVWDFLLVPDEVEPFKSVFAQLQAGQFPNAHENYWVAKDGARRRIHWTNSCLMDSLGAVEYVVATGIEVTERKLAEEALAASEERYRELVETTNSVILRWDRQGTIRFINKRGANLLGYDPHELIGRPVSTLVPGVESTGRDLSSLVQSILEHPEQYIYNPNENIRKDGTRIWIAWTNKAVTDEEGTVREILAIGNNITALKEAEHSLRESERRFHNLIEEDLSGNFLCTVEGRILLCNAAFADIFGFSSKEAAVGRSLLELYIDPGERNSILTAIRTQGKLAYYETWRKRCDGNPIHVVENLVGHFNDQGELYEIQGYIFDDTKRKWAEEALRQQAQLLHLSYDAILVWRKDGGIEHWNRGAEQLYGFTESEALGQVTHKLLKTIHPVPWPEIEAAMRKHGQWEGELRHFAKDGHEVTVSARHQHVLGTDRIERILETNRDITERKQMEEEIRKSRDELEIRVQERTAELTRTNESLRLEEARLDALLALSKISEEPLDKITNFTLEQAITLTGSKIGFVGFLSDDEKTYALHSVSKDVVKECKVEGNPVHWPVENAGIWADAIRERRTMFINDYSKPHPRKKGIPAGHVAIERFMVVPLIENKKIVTIAGVGNKESDYDSSDERQIKLLLSGMWGYVQRNRSRESLLAERKRFFEVLETLPVMICLLTKDHHVAFANTPFKKKFGESNGRHCFEYCFGKIEPCEFCESYKVLETGKPHHWEISSPDGLSVIDVYNFPFTDSDGSPMILEMDIDITEQRQAQEAIKAERQRFYDVLETLPVYVCLLTPDYHMPFANRVFRKWFGYYPDKKCYEFLFNRKEPCENCETFKVLKTNQPQRWEWTGPNGRNYDIFDFPFKDTDGSRLILEMGIDITERKKAQEALRATSLYARGLLEASLDPLVTISKEGKITDVNEATISVTGLSRKKLIGTDFSNYFTEPDKAKEGYKKVFDQGFVRDYPLTIRHKNGRLTDVLYNATVYKDTQGKVVGVFAAARDITEKKITEAELEKYRLHLEDLVKQRTTELARSNKDLEQFAYVASHDLQEPLRAVSGFVSLLQHSLENALDEKTREYMDFTVDGVARMQSLINGLLEYSRLDTRGKPPEKTDSGKSLNEALLDLQASIKESGVKITSDNLPTVNIDPVQLKQLFQNLISNAIKFRGEKPPKIHINADRKNSAWRFAVKDNGIGIEPEYYERIFMIFQRLHTRKKYPGTGIGLPLCKKIVERHGGNIWVESTPGHGSTFYFTIPDKEGSK